MAKSHLLERLFEESLYFVLLWHRWCCDEAWPFVRAGYFASVPAPFRPIAAWAARRRVQGYTRGQGIGLFSRAQIDARGLADLRAASSVLGDGEWFFGAPSTIDAIAHAWVANILCHPVEGRLQKGMPTNLRSHSERFSKAWWS